jgi:hypothetical protein
MTRSRVVVLLSFFVVALGIVAGLGAWALDPARASVGPLPGAGLALPAESRFLMGLDVKRFTASPFYAKFAQGPRRMDAFKTLEEKTGLNPERDLDELIMAGSGPGRREDGVVLALGRFDQYKLGRTIETHQKGVTSKKLHGTTLYMFGEGSSASTSIALLDDDALVMGGQKAVETVLANRAGSQAPLKANRGLMDLLGRVKPGSTFWMVGDQELLSNLPQNIPAPGGSAAMQLPPVKTVVMNADLDPEVSLEVTGEAADEAAARNLADVVRGLTALAALQANQRPELKQLASAVSVTTEAKSVHVNARLPYELLESLQGPASRKSSEAR